MGTRSARWGLRDIAGALGLGGTRDARIPPAGVRNVVNRVPFLDKELFAMRDFVPDGGTVVDVGAAGGAHALAAARLVGPSGTVIAIEARPGSAGILRAWRSVLGLDHVTVLATAIGAAPGSLDLRTPLVPTRSHADGGDDGTLLARLPARVRTVGMTTLDMVVAAQGLDRLDLLKVDVEGAEPDVLSGGEATIDRFRPVILIEVEDHYLQRSGRSAAEVHDWIAAKGYRAHVFGDAGLVPVAAVTPAQNNYLFVPTTVAGD